MFITNKGKVDILQQTDKSSSVYRSISTGAFVVVIVLLLNVELLMQSVPITINVVSSNLAHGEVHNIK